MAEQGKRAGFVYEAAEAPFEGFGVFFGSGFNRGVRVAEGKLLRQILLDGHCPLQSLVQAFVSDTKATTAE